MLKRYRDFLKEFDKFLESAFENQKRYIKCGKGCSKCCEAGDYPFSRLEMEYLMAGFQSLDKNVKNTIRNNIAAVKGQKEYKCPFLINNLCSLYERRGIICRTYGLAYLSDGKIKLPQCANEGLNYSEIFCDGIITISNPIRKNLKTDKILTDEIAQKYNLEAGEIRRLIDWF